MTIKPGLVTKGIVKNVVDGDTIDITVRKTIRVRLIGTSAPEIKTKNVETKLLGYEIKHYVEDAILGKEVMLIIPFDENLKDILSLDRVLGIIYLDGENFNEVIQREIDARKNNG